MKFCWLTKRQQALTNHRGPNTYPPIHPDMKLGENYLFEIKHCNCTGILKIAWGHFQSRFQTEECIGSILVWEPGLSPRRRAWSTASDRPTGLLSSLTCTSIFSEQRQEREDLPCIMSDMTGIKGSLWWAVKWKVPPRFELGSVDSKSNVLTITP